MVFYVSLFLVSLVVAALCVWFYRFVVQASKSTYRTILPSANDNIRMSAMEGVTQSRRAQRDKSTPWGWGKARGNEGKVSVAIPANHRAQRQAVGWPYRNEPFSFDEGPDVTARSTMSKPRKATKGGVSKPWGW